MPLASPAKKPSSWWAQGEAIVVDVRDKAAWEGNHAVGSLSIPASEMARRIGELPKDKMILAYCT